LTPRLRGFAPPLDVAPLTLSFLSAKAAARKLEFRGWSLRETIGPARNAGCRAPARDESIVGALRARVDASANQQMRFGKSASAFWKIHRRGALNGTLFHQLPAIASAHSK
jgi:hypothetical protein